MPPSLVLTTRGAGPRAGDASAKALAAYRAGRHDEAGRRLGRAVEPAGAPPELRFFLAACHVKSGRAGAAAEQLEALVAARPAVTEYRWALAQALLLLGRGEEAMVHVTKVGARP